MKNYFLFGLLFGLIMINSDSLSQNFITAGVSESGFGLNLNVQNTGNDILDLSGNSYEVTVWDDINGNSPGIGWNVVYNGSPYSGTTTFATTSVRDPDVCLIHAPSGRVFAVVAYYRTGVDFICEIYQWSPVLFTFNFQSATALNSTGGFGTTVNIDGNDNGDFVIIWDDGNSQVYVVTGSLAGGSPAINNSSPVSMNTGRYPDVCLYYEQTSPVTDHIFMVYIDGNGDLIVDIDRFNSVAGGIAAPIRLADESPNTSFAFPRIACPPPTTGLAYDWHVVVQDGNLIVGIDSGSCCPMSPKVFRYNNGSTPGSTDISSEPNERPAVAYDANGNVWVGWTFDNSSGNIGGTVAAKYPIVVSCDYDGTPLNSDYWDVPTSGILTTGSDINTLSIAGKYSSASNLNLYSFYDSGASDVYSKSVSNTATSLKIPDNFQWNMNNIFEGNGLFESNNMYLSVSDLMGREIFKATGNINDLKSQFSDMNIILNNNIYLVNIMSVDGKIFKSVKIFLMK